jgi:hypothetical protein
MYTSSRKIYSCLVAATVLGAMGTVAHTGEQAGVPPDVVANYIHALVQADRTLYTTHVVERLQELGVTVASEHWKAQGTLPLPAQMLMMTGWEVEGQGTGLRIRLTSLWPINHKNGPTDDFERAGLETVGKTPNKPFTGIITQGDKRLFKAIYPDRAVSTACIDCHNGHQASRKRNYKLNDVMGAVIVSFPLP